MALCAVVILLLATPTFILGQSKGVVAGSTADPGSEWRDFWLFRLTLNLLGYAVIVVPGYLIIRYVRKSNALDTSGKKILKCNVQGYKETV